MKPSEERVRYEVVFIGRVQGVYFRATVADLAPRFDVTGWVRNEADGSVRLIAEGAPSSLDAFVDAIEKAKHGFIVNRTIERHAATGEWSAFSIRR